MDWLDLLAVQGTLKSLLQHHSSKPSILRCSAFFTVQLSHPYGRDRIAGPGVSWDRGGPARSLGLPGRMPEIRVTPLGECWSARGAPEEGWWGVRRSGDPGTCLPRRAAPLPAPVLSAHRPGGGGRPHDGTDPGGRVQQGPVTTGQLPYQPLRWAGALTRATPPTLEPACPPPSFCLGRLTACVREAWTPGL